MKKNILIVAVLITVIYGCKKDDASEPDKTGSTNTGGGSASREQVIKDYQEVYLANFISPSTSVWQNGSVSSCTPGNVSAETNQKVLTLVNYFRKLAGLPGKIVFDEGRNAKCQQAALMMTANNALNHQPPTSWSCYTEDGAEGAIRANLSWGHTADGLFKQMRDDGGGNYYVGHRRLILSPKGKVFGHGSTDAHMALWVVDNSHGSAVDGAPEYISWPPKGFCPSAFNFNRWSFSVVGGADYSSATVSMKDANGNAVTLTMENFRTGFGEDTIVWVPQGINNDTEYTITIDGVKVNGQNKTYTYTTTIVPV